MKKVTWVLVVLLFTFISTMNVSAQTGDEKRSVIYFYSSTCSSCVKLQEFLRDVEQGHNVEIIKLNIAESGNKGLLNTYCEYYKVEEDRFGTVPIAFVGSKYLHGEKEIKDYLVDCLEDKNYEKTPIFNEKNYDYDVKVFKKLNIGMVFFTGLVNGVNPCSLSMIIFLLSLIIGANSSIRKYGLSFILGKFIAFFVLGLIFYSILNRINVEILRWLTKLILAIATSIFMVLNVHDFIVIKNNKYEKIKLQLPPKLIKANHKLMKNINFSKSSKLIMIGCFLLGALIACGEFLCTGQVYLSTIVAIIHYEASYTLKGILYLLIFDCAFVLPLIICVIVMAKGKKVYEMSNMVIKRMPYIKLLNATTFFIIMLVYVVFS